MQVFFIMCLQSYIAKLLQNENFSLKIINNTYCFIFQNKLHEKNNIPEKKIIEMLNLNRN